MLNVAFEVQSTRHVSLQLPPSRQVVTALLGFSMCRNDGLSYLQMNTAISSLKTGHFHTEYQNHSQPYALGFWISVSKETQYVWQPTPQNIRPATRTMVQQVHGQTKCADHHTRTAEAPTVQPLE
jgi:hypothetical protein